MNEKQRVHLNLARLKKAGEMFEIDVNPDLALQLKAGEQVDIREVLNAERVFSDAQKGLQASDDKLQATFGTTDPLEVAKAIIADGEIQLTSEHRAKLRDQKKQRLLTLLHKYGVDPRTKAPHPIGRIEAAIEEAKVKIDFTKRVEDQVQPVLRQLQPILPIAFEKKTIRLHIDVNHASKAYATVKSMGKLQEESWNNDGSWTGIIEIPGGLEQELYDKLQKLTAGTLQAEVLH